MTVPRLAASFVFLGVATLAIPQPFPSVSPESVGLSPERLALATKDHYAYTVSDGEFWWDGSAGTRFWIDPTLDMITIVNAQVSPARGGGFREAFKTLVCDAIIPEEL